MTVFAPNSISFRLYPHALGPVEILEEMAVQAALAVESGFEGIMVSERHGGVPGNVPNPTQVLGFLGERMKAGWIAPCPVLILLRPLALVIEDVAWLAARYPGRVGVGFGTGGHDLDFRMYGVARDDLAARFEVALAAAVHHLSGSGTDEVDLDHAVARCRVAPVPVVSATMSNEAARRAARCGAGTIGSSLTTLDRERQMSEAYRNAGGSGPELLIRHVWLGTPPRDAINAKLAEYRRSGEASRAAGAARFETDEIIASKDADEIAGRLVDALRYTGKTCLHLRVQMPAIPPELVREQIQLLGQEVLPRVRRLVSAASA
jgi:alkanesulfonate monooxygenase SsuD/methylene tetrahydromethanopterin reductase-like flavin-dependent oxidoreductase (luciferase family)